MNPQPTPDALTGAEAPAFVDIVDSWEEAAGLEAEPLIVLEGLRAALGSDELPQVERIDAGYSNPTFVVCDAGRRYVLRRPPRPPFAPKAHDVLREYRILAALKSEAVRAPTPALMSEDPAHMNAPFYLMEALDGVVLRGATTPPFDTPEQRALIGAELIDALAELHDVDAGSVGLGDPARGEQYLARQLDLWSGQWEERAGRRDIPEIDVLSAWLRAEMPVSRRVAIVHGDYKLDNVFFARDAPARLIAILDWEMATLGDPLADLGFLTGTWTQAGEDPEAVGGLSAVTAEPGFPTRRELAERYAQRSGLPLDDLAWYQALAVWKLAILLEATYQRYRAGTLLGERFAQLEEGIPRMAALAHAASTGALL
ncbi:unannotated protein [freshwater metagenome]|uniref:Unannotated protein n=1 Tax=freshwater metagenome TaxID=449393 RepID=A0A6J7CI92_9ZZZZ|nr:phosphotransferase [Actinomycetota bacterium]